MLNAFSELALWWLIYAFLGWCIEVVRHAVGQKKLVSVGFVFGPFCTIYGFGAIAVILISKPFTYNPLIVFALSVIIASAVEYVGHWLLEKLYSLSLWDYSESFCNVRGRICLSNSLTFGVLSLVVVYGIQPCLESVTPLLPKVLVYGLAAISAFWFIIDVCISLFKEARIERVVARADRYRKHRRRSQRRN